MAGSPAVRAAFAELKKSLAGSGFVADSPTLYIRSDLGDYVLVEFQRSQQVWPDRLPRIFVNMAAVPAPQWDWLKTLYPTRHPGATHPCAADGVWHRRLQHDIGSDFPDDRWTPSANTREAGTAMGQDMAVHLQTELPLLLSLLDRETLMTQFAGYNMHELHRLEARMLADTGPSADLDNLLERFEPDDNTRRFVQWARRYAAGHRV